MTRIGKNHINRILYILLALSGILSVFVFTLQGVVNSLIGAEADPNKVIFYYHKEVNGKVNCNSLYPTTIKLSPEEKNVEFVIHKIVKGVDHKDRVAGFVSFFSAQTASILRSINIEKKLVYIDFYDLEEASKTVNSALYGCTPAQYLKPIEKTLQANFDISKIVYAIEGDPKKAAEWTTQGCGVFKENCPSDKFTQGSTELTKAYSTLSGAVEFKNTDDWFVLQDSGLETRYDDNTLITKTLISDQYAEDTALLPEAAVKILIIEKVGKSNKAVICDENESACQDITIGGISGKVKQSISETTLTEEIELQRNDKTYIITLDLPYNNTANKEYSISRKIIESIKIN